MAQFGTQTDVLQRASAHVDQVNAEIQSKLSSLASMVAGTSGFWAGDAQKSFTMLMERWDTDAAKLTDALAGISAAMSQSGASYAATEESGTSTIRSAGSGLSI